MKCEQVIHAGGGNPGSKRSLYSREGQFKQEKELPVKDVLPIEEALPVEHSLQIKAAEYWLKLGEADLALKELEKLPTRIWQSGWALKTRIAAMRVMRERDERKIQA